MRGAATVRVKSLGLGVAWGDVQEFVLREVGAGGGGWGAIMDMVGGLEFCPAVRCSRSHYRRCLKRRTVTKNRPQRHLPKGGEKIEK